MSIDLRAQAAAVCAPYRPWQPVTPPGEQPPDDADADPPAPATRSPRPSDREPRRRRTTRDETGSEDDVPNEAEAWPVNGVPYGTERLVSAAPGGLPVFETLVAESRPGLFDQLPVAPPPDDRPGPRHA
ncbi:MAG TPA: hypothetical protein VGR21_11800 [Cryptosporangiaceae bacterium]|nr:hypothetical protein [Cryptosporangiaceae bacterium]